MLVLERSDLDFKNSLIKVRKTLSRDKNGNVIVQDKTKTSNRNEGSSYV